MKYLTTGQLAKSAEVHIETVRYYERKGLIPVPPRRKSGYRSYPPDTVTRIQFIKRAQALGFSLTEISDLLSLRLEPDASCAEIKNRALSKIEQIEVKIESLKKIKRTLQEISCQCDGENTIRDCSILKAFEE